MCRFLAARRAACWLFIVVTLARTAAAQTWNDPRSRALVERATARRTAQLTDTSLTAYQATAHGYVTFLAQLGQGFRTPPKIVKADELELEVYWHAPNLSKQRIIGRRDTLLLPTDIAYHSDHLGIIQNNFPSTIRIGEGDEVRDVPHPLSAMGLGQYDFALADSFALGAGAQRIHVYAVKVRPKDAGQPRVVGVLYIDPADSQVVRMDLSFTHAAFLDKSLEELSVVLENRLVSGRFWLPSRQEIEIRRTGTWLDYPVRGIIRGRWEIGDYKFDIAIPTAIFSGQEIVQAPRPELNRYPWTGAVLDSLPPDVRAVTDADVARVQAEAREMVRADALSRAQHVTMSARNLSDFARVDRVEGLALGDGLSKQLGRGYSVTARGRYGIDDHQAKGSATLSWLRGSGTGVHLYAMRDFRDVGDEPERSSVVNSLAAQEFGSDYTDPYRVTGGGLGLELAGLAGLHWRLDGTLEQHDSVSVHARPVTGRFEATIPAAVGRVARVALHADRAPGLWLFGTELSANGNVRWTNGVGGAATANAWDGVRTLRANAVLNIERPIGRERLVSHTTAARVWSSQAFVPPEELVYLGGPVSAPGYDYHSLISTAAVAEHLEWQFPIPFVPFSLGRFGRVPATAALAPYAHGVESGGRFLPSLGAAFLTPFNLLRFDVARGVGRGGRWTFAVDVSREFWSVL